MACRYHRCEGRVFPDPVTAAPQYEEGPDQRQGQPQPALPVKLVATATCLLPRKSRPNKDEERDGIMSDGDLVQAGDDQGDQKDPVRPSHRGESVAYRSLARDANDHDDQRE